MNDTITKCVSTEELNRRWKAVREQMAEKGIDYLIIQNNESFLGGTLRWFTDFAARQQMQMTVIFPLEGEMTTIACGTEPPNDNWPPQWASRGIGRRLGDVYFPTLNYTRTYDAKLAADVLQERPDAVIGWAEPAFISFPFAEYLKKQLPKATFVDATDWLDEIKAVKSPEEIKYIKESAALEDAGIEELKKIIIPGKKCSDVYAELHCFFAKNGSERGLIQVGTGPLGTNVAFDTPRFQNRVIKEGDQVMVLIEISGPCGYWTEMLRPIVLGKASAELKEGYAAAVEMQEMTAKNMVPGASCKDLWEMHKSFNCEYGYAPPLRSFAHAQGLSFLERPNLRPDEVWRLKEGMNIAVHPSAVKPGAVAMTFDNYIVQNNGGELLHKTPKTIIEL